MAVDATPGNVAVGQLKALPFDNLIGSPLMAAVKAQNLAAKAAVEFIQNVGFTTDANGKREVINVTFTYQKGTRMVNLMVPLLTIVPIPYIRIDDVTIAFKAKINASSSSTDTTSSSLEAGVKVGGGWSGFGASVNFEASVSSKKDSTSSRDSKYAIEYTMDVNVHAVQDDMPAGMEKVLNLLNDSINSAPEGGAVNFTLDRGTIQLDPSGTTEINCSLQLVDGGYKPIKDKDLSGDIANIAFDSGDANVTGAFTFSETTTNNNGAIAGVLTITSDPAQDLTSTTAKITSADIEAESGSTSKINLEVAMSK